MPQVVSCCCNEQPEPESCRVDAAKLFGSWFYSWFCMVSYVFLVAISCGDFLVIVLFWWLCVERVNIDNLSSGSPSFALFELSGGFK